MNAEIVEVTPDTADVLAEVAEDVFDYPIDPGHLAGYLAVRGQVMFVAVAAGQVVGQIRGVVIRHPDKAPDMFVENLATSPNWQRQGIATRLVAALKDWSAAVGCDAIWVATEADNAEGLGFYRALGLRETPVAMFD